MKKTCVIKRFKNPVSDSAKQKPRKRHVHMPPDAQLVYDALRGTQGNMAQAAELLNVTRAAVSQWFDHVDYPERRVILDQIRNDCVNNLLDLAETTIQRNMGSKHGPTSNRAANIAMQYMGKKRGHVPASYVEQSNTDDVTVTVVREED